MSEWSMELAPTYRANELIRRSSNEGAVRAEAQSYLASAESRLKKTEDQLIYIFERRINKAIRPYSFFLFYPIM